MIGLDGVGESLRRAGHHLQPLGRVLLLHLRAQGDHGVDLGAAEKPMVEDVPVVPAAGDLGFEQLAGPRGVADDLKKLPGVSPAIEKQLNDLGIFHYQQIAELNDKAAHNVGEEVGLPGRVGGWVSKAKELTAE